MFPDIYIRMAKDPNKDNLEALVSIQQQLAANTDLIKEQTSRAGALGMEFNNVLTSAKGVNTALLDAAKMQSDINKQLFTNAKVKKAMEEIDAQAVKVQAMQAASLRSMSNDQKEMLGYAVEAKKGIEEQEKVQAEIQSKLKDAKTSTAERTALVQQMTQSMIEQEKLEADMYFWTEEKKVAQALLLHMQEQSLEKAKAFVREAEKERDIAGALEGKMKDIKGAWSGLAGTLGGMFSKIKDAVFDIDNKLVSISKNSGTSAEFSKGMLNNYQNTVRTMKVYNADLDKALINVTGMLQAQQELQASTNQMALFTKKSVQDQMYITKQLGLQADEAARIQQLGMLEGKQTSDVTDEVYEQVAQYNRINKTRLSGKDVLKDVAKIEGVLAANYKNNPKLIAAAVAQAKALGISLEQAAAASNSLDFESSIESELQAELLTGKRFNLEKARSLALDGDSAGAMREMLKNVGSLAEFQKQNVIAKQAEAQAMGMSVDELANALRTSELMKGVSQETLKAIEESGDKTKYMAELNAATNAKEMKAAEGRVSMQMQYEESMTRVREQLAILAHGPMQSMVKFMTSLTENAGVLKGILVITAGVMAAMAASAVTTAIAMTVAQGGKNLISAGAAMGIIGAAGGLGVLGAGLAMSSIGSSNNTGETLNKPTPAAATSTFSSNREDMSKTNSLLASIADKQDKLIAKENRPYSIHMDSTKVGTEAGKSYNRLP